VPNKSHYPVIVIGAGPAGTSAAYTLAKEGKKVLIIDKATFPREKLCGGLLTGRSKRVFLQVFNKGWNDAIEHTTDGAEIYEGTRLLNKVYGHCEFHQSKRLHFDDYLLKRCEALGVEMLLGDGLLELDLQEQKIRMKSGALLTYDYLIGADGVNSVVAKTIFGESFNKKDIGFALEVEIPKGQQKWVRETPSLHFDVVNWGYGWIFPKSQSDTFGLAGLHRLNPDMKERFQAFHQQVYGKPFDGKIKGHYIPFGTYRKKATDGKNVLLTGDAAGLVDPITGEGIAFALESGNLAGLAVVQSMESGRSAWHHYRPMYKELALDIEIGHQLARLLYPTRMNKLFRRILPKTEFLMRAHMDLMNEKMSYAQFRSYVFQRLFKYGWRLVKMYFSSTSSKIPSVGS
jgi:geranylgeranyl reductase family protein